MTLDREKIESRCFGQYQMEMARIADEVGIPPDASFRKIAGKFRGNFYNIYPFLFCSHYPSVSLEDIIRLTLAGNLYFSYLLVLDELLDGDTQTSSLLILHAIHEHSMERLYQLFSPDNPFWSHFRTYRSEFLSANRLTESAASLEMEWENESEESLGRIARNKSAFAKCATAGLMALAGEIAADDPLAETQEHFHLGMQLLDDLQDWKEDYLGHHQSYLLALCFSDEAFVQTLQERPDDEIGVLGRYIYYSGVSEKIFALAKKAFLDALSTSSTFDIPWWRELVESYIKKVSDLERDFLETQDWLLRKRRKVEEIHSKPPAGDPVYRMIQDTFPLGGLIVPALQFLLLEQQNSYLEMQHRMTLPDLSEDKPIHSGINVVGDLFQRTIVLDALLDINTLNAGTIGQKVVSTETSFIVDSSMKSVRGGWNYFPGYGWLPPDSDDLAQVIVSMARTDSEFLRPFLDDCIDLVITSNRYKDGTFHTWILDPEDTGEIQIKLRSSVAEYWGERLGKDIEVTANLAFALSVFGRLRFERIVREASDAVIRAQSNNGYWASVWYCGPFYGTYVASRLLSFNGIGIESLRNAANFLMRSQLACGGWGGKEGEPLNTALALLSLGNVRAAGLEVDRLVLERAVRFLGREQKRTGSWRPTPFIKMFIGSKDIIYRSETITTAFVTKALAQLSIQMSAMDKKTGPDHVLTV